MTESDSRKLSTYDGHDPAQLKAAFMELVAQHLFTNLHTVRFAVQGIQHELEFRPDPTALAHDCRVLSDTLESVNKFYAELLDVMRNQLNWEGADWSALARWDNTGTVLPRHRNKNG